MSYVGGVATKGRMPNDSSFNYSTSFIQGMSRSHHVARATMNDIKVVLPNWWWDESDLTEKGNGGTMTAEAALEYPAGTFTRLTFAGSNSGTAASGAELESDLVALSAPITNGDSFWVRSYISNPNGFVFLNSRHTTIVCDNSYGANHGEAIAFGSSISNQVMGGTITPTNSNSDAPIYSPLVVAATTTAPTCLIQGDSRQWGAFAGMTSGGDKGELAPSIAAAFGYTNLGSYGDTCAGFIASHTRRVGLKRFFSHMLSNFGINDLGAYRLNRAASAVEADMQTIYGYFSDKIVLQSTIAPVNGDANAAQINAYNDNIRTTPSPLAGYFEVSDVVSTSRNSNTWKTGYNYDTIHENDTGYAAILSSGAVGTGKITLQSISAAASFFFSPAAMVRGSVALAAAATFAFAPTASLVPPQIQTHASVSFASAASLGGKGALISAGAISFALTAILGAPLAIATAASFQFTPSATIFGMPDIGFTSPSPVYTFKPEVSYVFT